MLPGWVGVGRDRRRSGSAPVPPQSVPDRPARAGRSRSWGRASRRASAAAARVGGDGGRPAGGRGRRPPPPPRQCPTVPPGESHGGMRERDGRGRGDWSACEHPPQRPGSAVAVAAQPACTGTSTRRRGLRRANRAGATLGGDHRRCRHSVITQRQETAGASAPAGCHLLVADPMAAAILHTGQRDRMRCRRDQHECHVKGSSVVVMGWSGEAVTCCTRGGPGRISAQPVGSFSGGGSVSSDSNQMRISQSHTKH